MKLSKSFFQCNSFAPGSLQIQCLLGEPRGVEARHPGDIQAPTPCTKLYCDEKHSRSSCWELHWVKFWEPVYHKWVHNPDPYQTTANHFVLGQSATCKVMINVSKAIRSHLYLRRVYADVNKILYTFFSDRP